MKNMFCLMISTIVCVSLCAEPESTYTLILTNFGDTTITTITPENLDSICGFVKNFEEKKLDKTLQVRKFEATLPDFYGSKCSIAFSDQYTQIRTGWIVESFSVTVRENVEQDVYAKYEKIAQEHIPESLWVQENYPNRFSWYIVGYGMATLQKIPRRGGIELVIEVNEGKNDNFMP